MKKYLLIALAALPVLFACNKGNSTQGSSLDTPKYAKNAAKVVITGNPIQVSTKNNKDVALKVINFMRSGRFVAEAEASKAETTIVYLTGTYTMENGNYKVSGDISATFTLTDNSIACGSQSSSATVTHSNVVEGSAQDQVYRTWRLQGDSSAIILEFASLGGKAKYANISNLVNDLVNHGITISDERKARLLGYDIVDITLDEGVVTVNFTSADPFKGTFSVNNNYAFSYDLSSVMSGDLFQTTASGQVSVTGKKAAVSMNVVSGIEKLGNGTATINLVAVE